MNNCKYSLKEPKYPTSEQKTQFTFSPEKLITGIELNNQLHLKAAT